MFYIALAAFSVLLIMVSVQYYSLKSVLEHTRENNISASLENMSPLLARSLWFFDEASIEEASSAILRDQFITGISLNDHKDLYRLKLGDLSNQVELNPQIESQQDISSAHRLRYQVPLIINFDQGQPINIGTLLVTSDNKQLNQQIFEVAKISLLVSVVVIILLLAIVSIITKWVIAQPLESFTAHVQTQMQNLDTLVIEHKGNLGVRNDEIGRLYREFNAQHKALFERDQNLALYQAQLESTVQQRTSELSTTNQELSQSLEQLQVAQKELIQQEKLASLGALVSGIAHEVNTPLGIAITATSNLSEEIKITHQQFIDGTLTKTGFNDFFDTCLETELLLTSNLNRAGKLIQSFKMVAVDQASDEQRQFNLYKYTEEIITSLSPTLRKTKVNVENNIDPNIMLYSFAGAYSQVLTNLISNSLLHGFKNGSLAGNISINSEDHADFCTIIYRDTGKGMPANVLEHIYDPFYTTTRAEGGSGLGMNIVYNLITSKLDGMIETTSEPEQGIKVTMTLRKQKHNNKGGDHE
ncbi:sensor histidine kinase [Reinekea sp.]|jgi:two-component system NtrC family sensor kinase|uniref:sensor histidine kinase n=1 Tax=Reinekea sp. TaxID=1970455 RepID=UPI00398A316E